MIWGQRVKALGDLDSAHDRVLKEARALLSTVRECAATTPETVDVAIRTLAEIRAQIYEDLNQLQHEHLILRAAAWLVANHVVTNSVSWLWNPRQTGDATEPDLAAEVNGARLISAEITTSAEPMGKIDSRMAATLEKLERMDGVKYYFVRSESMRRRAETKVTKRRLSIEIVLIDTGAVLIAE